MVVILKKVMNKYKLGPEYICMKIPANLTRVCLEENKHQHVARYFDVERQYLAFFLPELSLAIVWVFSKDVLPI